MRDWVFRGKTISELPNAVLNEIEQMLNSPNVEIEQDEECGVEMLRERLRIERTIRASGQR